MKTKKMNFLSLTTLLFIFSCTSTPPQFADRNPAGLGDCYEAVVSFIQKEIPIFALVHSEITPKYITESMAQNSLRYPKGFEDLPGKNIQYGFESEYLYEDSEAFFVNFMPEASIFPDGEEAWLSLSHEQRLKWIDGNISKIFPYREKGKLVKISDNLELKEALPDSFVYDNGHFEIVLDPMDSAEELIKKVKTINKHFGVGSMQVTISNPLNKDLLKKNKVYKKELKSEILGYYNFMNDFDTLNKLGVGYERYLKDPTVDTAKSFAHSFLGPMTKLKHERLSALIEGIIEQKKYTEEELKDISKQVISHKFIGGLSFRPDVAYKKGRIASEIRDCHQNLKCIEDRVIRETYFLMKGKENFYVFSKLKPFDSMETFKALPDEVQRILKKNFPARYGSTLNEAEIFRNFAYPLRDWSQHITTFKIPGLKASVKRAQKAYIEALVEIANDLKYGKYMSAEGRTKIMGALGEFAKNSGLVDAMKNQYEHLIDPSELKYFDHLKFALWLRSVFGIA
jgi:hypothetical protein